MRGALGPFSCNALVKAESFVRPARILTPAGCAFAGPRAMAGSALDAETCMACNAGAGPLSPRVSEVASGPSAPRRCACWLACLVAPTSEPGPRFSAQPLRPAPPKLRRPPLAKRHYCTWRVSHINTSLSVATRGRAMEKGSTNVEPACIDTVCASEPSAAPGTVTSPMSSVIASTNTICWWLGCDSMLFSIPAEYFSGTCASTSSVRWSPRATNSRCTNVSSSLDSSSRRARGCIPTSPYTWHRILCSLVRK
mmetsp:Transcript_15253/g.57625  ORF Transcript_15253/g.57625 Transcript_15253/m.57625 type:complete len:253 (+) Transcript_15253:642-1400(+)